jgi:hypothetical protein
VKIMGALGVVFVGLVLATVLGGAALPATRQGAVTRSLDAEPGLVRRTMLDAASQPTWRATVAAVEHPTAEGWTELTHDGERVSFRVLQNTGEALHLTFESSRGYVGRFTATFVRTASGGTTLTVQEEATTPSPFGRIASRLFFDPEAFAAAYLDELAREVEKRRARRGGE